jgi:hypothetical protein
LPQFPIPLPPGSPTSQFAAPYFKNGL